MCIELILAEYSGYMAQVGLEAVEHDPSQDLTFELEAARYNNARDLRLDLAARLQHIGTILRNLERCARLGGFPHGKFKELAANRYGPDHPWTWICPYLDPAKLHIYLDCYPGLSEMKVGLYPEDVARPLIAASQELPDSVSFDYWI